MKILALETSGATLSIAISENSAVITEYFYNAGKIHSDILITLINKILKDVKWTLKDIDKFAVSCGPGSFTGIRVAMTVAKTFAQAENKPLVSVDSVSILEKQAEIKNIKTVAAIDALRNEVYTKDKNNIVIMPAEKFVNKYRKYKNNIYVAGNAALVYKDILIKELGKNSVSLPAYFVNPSAGVLALMAEDIPGTGFSRAEPLYIRKSWAEETARSK